MVPMPHIPWEGRGGGVAHRITLCSSWGCEARKGVVREGMVQAQPPLSLHSHLAEGSGLEHPDPSFRSTAWSKPGSKHCKAPGSDVSIGTVGSVPPNKYWIYISKKKYTKIYQSGLDT